jgi:hypothetical protein
MTRLPDRVEQALRAWGGDDALVLAAPLAILTSDSSYIRERAIAIETIARNTLVAWPLRRLAALMLETALARISASETRERRFWIARFGATAAAELRCEGFAANAPMEVQFWRRQARLRRVHRLAAAARKNDVALRDFLRASEHECRLTIARYLFGASETVAHIEQHLRHSEGIPDAGEHGWITAEREHLLAKVPAMEQEIVQHLARDSVMRWVTPAIPKAVNELVAQPAGTVVTTIRPPGSTHEIQIKRTGRPRELPLDIVFKRNGVMVPSAHHLDGGSCLDSASGEAASAAFFSRVFREVHGFDAAMSRTLYVARVDTLPTANGDADLMEYFTDPKIFGSRYFEMRWSLYHSVRNLADCGGVRFKAGDDDTLTREFIRLCKPAQSIQIGTTALRLDLLRRYLKPNGAREYFQKALGIRYDAEDARRFADEILDEILGNYDPPDVTWRSYGHYIEAALCVDSNRRLAGRIYLSLLEQTGRFWGTLLAIRGHSQGESFVERNAGLSSVWRDGKWQVQIVFMDHDSLNFGTLGTTIFRPRVPVLNASADADHILGAIYEGGERQRGVVGCLRDIYRIERTIQRRGNAVLRAATKRAYDKTHAAIRRKPSLSALFPQAIVPRLRDWDEVVKSYLGARTRGARDEWTAVTRAKLLVRGYDHEAVEEHLTMIPGQARFLRRLAFLF